MDEPIAQGGAQIDNTSFEGLSDEEISQFWVGEIERTKQYFKSYWDTCDRIIERYRDERGRNEGTGHRTSEGGRIQTKRFNILWSNVKTLFPALYGGTPDPSVSRRYKDEDPLAMVASEVLERCLQFCLDPAAQESTVDSAARAAVLAYLLPGRGVTWIRYERTTEEIETAAVLDDETGEELAAAQSETRVLSEKLLHDNVQYRDYMHKVAPDWDRVLRDGWVARCTYKTRADVAKQFGPKVAADIKLTATDTSGTSGRLSRDDTEKKGKRPAYAEVWEIWNKPDRKVYFSSPGHKGPMRDVNNSDGEDPLRLRDFYPTPRPIFATVTDDTLLPVADYVQYHDQADNLDRITNKKWQLTTALRVAGLYAGKEGEKLQQLFDGTDRNVMIPVQDWEDVREGGGVAGLITWLPLDTIIVALRGLQEMEEDNKQQIYEITGIADIIRGQSKASETLGAQRLKGQWASVRISDRQEQVAEYVRQILRIDAEIIAEHFDIKTIAEMTNFANSELAERYGDTFQQAVQLLRDDKMRTYQIDVETRDTVFADEMQERQQNVEMIGGISQFMASATELGMANPYAIPVLGEMLKIATKSFSGRSARRLEVAVDEMVARMKERMEEQENAPPQPSPEEIEAQQKQQESQQKAQTEQAKLQIERQGQVLDFQGKVRDQALEKRKQDLEFLGKDKDRLAQLLAKVAGGNA